jgi:lantibiotic biosynthesis protein
MQISRPHILPFVLARISAGDFTSFQKLNLTKSLVYLDKITKLSLAMDKLKNDISACLYQEIAEIGDYDKKINLIHLRRDIFNDRIDNINFKDIQPILKKSIVGLLYKYLKYRNKLNLIMKKSLQVYDQELQALNSEFIKLASDDTFKKGLLLSTASLIPKLEKYLKSNDKNCAEFDKLKISLSKYLSRMYAKTTPYGSFTNLAAASISDNFESTSLIKHNGKGKLETKSYVKLNNYLFYYLKILLSKNPRIRKLLTVKLNSTIRLDNNQYVYLTNNDNKESIQRINRTETLDMFYKLSNLRQTYGDLVSKIIKSDSINATTTEIEDYLDQLIDYGFFEFDFQVSGIDPDWAVKFIKTLDVLDKNDAIIQKVKTMLTKLNHYCRLYSKADYEKRQQILTNSFTLYRATCFLLHKDANLPKSEHDSFLKDFYNNKINIKKKKEDTFKHHYRTDFNFKPQNMFYEDVKLTNQLIINKSKLNRLVFNLNILTEKCSWLDMHTLERSQINKFFLKKYGTDARIDLFKFYEDYYREYKKPNEKKYKIQDTEDIKQFKKKKKQFIRKFTNSIRSQLREATDHIHLTAKNFPTVNKDFIPSSFSSYLQHANDSDNDIWILNALTSGYGRNLSRFLSLFPNNIKSLVRSDLEALNINEIWAENTDASNFNANIHPALMPFEISAPGSNNSLPANNQIAITDLKLTFNKQINKLELIDKKTRKTVRVFDVCLQGMDARSELYRFLDSFSQTLYIPYAHIYQSINKSYKYYQMKDKLNFSKKYWITPRIIYENNIILQRKAFMIHKDLLPLKGVNENEFDYLVKVNLWRYKYNIPDEGFIYLTDRRKKRKNTKKSNHDDYKPQYINFQNPMLIDLFLILIKKTPDYLKIEEMLPNSNQLTEFGVGKYTSEYIMQWRNN